MPGKRPLREDVNASALEIGIEPLVGLSVFYIKTVYVVLIETERTAVLLGLDDMDRPVLDGVVQQPVADKVDQPVGRYAVSVFRKLFGERLDKGDDIIKFLLWGLETAFATTCYEELVATYTCAVTKRADIGRVTQAVTPVQVIARVQQYVLDIQPLQEIIVCLFSVCHCFSLILIKILSAFPQLPGSSALQSSLQPHPSIKPHRE